jgi:hypothetical protein
MPPSNNAGADAANGASVPPPVAAAEVKRPHNPNRGGAPPDLHRPFLVQHPLFTYTTTVPVSPALAQRFSSPFADEKDFTSSPALLYAHAAPVEECVQRHLTKYPHPSQPDILACPVVSDETDPATGVRTRKRKVVCANIAPWLMRRALGSSDTVQLSETNVYDPRSREFTLHSQNDNFTGLVVAREASKYAPHPDNPQWSVNSGETRMLAHAVAPQRGWGRCSLPLLLVADGSLVSCFFALVPFFLLSGLCSCNTAVSVAVRTWVP